MTARDDKCGEDSRVQEVFDNWSAYLRDVDRQDFRNQLAALCTPSHALQNAAPQASATLSEDRREGGPDTGVTREDAKPGHAGAGGAAPSTIEAHVLVRAAALREAAKVPIAMFENGSNGDDDSMLVDCSNRILDLMDVEAPASTTPRIAAARQAVADLREKLKPRIPTFDECADAIATALSAASTTRQTMTKADFEMISSALWHQYAGEHDVKTEAEERLREIFEGQTSQSATPCSADTARIDWLFSKLNDNEIKANIDRVSNAYAMGGMTGIRIGDFRGAIDQAMRAADGGKQTQQPCTCNAEGKRWCDHGTGCVNRA